MQTISLRSRLVDGVTTLLEVAGLAAVAFGAGLVYVPAGVIVGGASAVLVGWLAGRPAPVDDVAAAMVERIRAGQADSR